MTAGTLGTLLMVGSALAAHAQTPWPQPSHAAMVSVISLAQYLPSCFAIEEVSMRAVVDAELARSLPRA